MIKKKKVKKNRKLDYPKFYKRYYLNETTCYSYYLKYIECDGIISSKCENGYYSNEMNCFSYYSNCFECNSKKCINGYYSNNIDYYKRYSNCLECDEKYVKNY